MRSLYLQTKFATYTACPCTGEQNGRLKRNALTNAKDPKWITDRATRMQARSRCRRKLLRARSLARLEALDSAGRGARGAGLGRGPALGHVIIITPPSDASGRRRRHLCYAELDIILQITHLGPG